MALLYDDRHVDSRQMGTRRIRQTNRPQGCHRPHIPTAIDKLLVALDSLAIHQTVYGCQGRSWRQCRRAIVDELPSASTHWHINGPPIPRSCRTVVARAMVAEKEDVRVRFSVHVASEHCSTAVVYLQHRVRWCTRIMP